MGMPYGTLEQYLEKKILLEIVLKTREIVKKTSKMVLFLAIAKLT